MTNPQRAEQSQLDLWPADAFATWWASCPIRKQRHAAERAFERVRGSGEITFDALIAATARYANQVAKERTPSKYILYPANWLNSGSYLDDDDAAPGSSNGAAEDPKTFTLIQWTARVERFAQERNWSPKWGPQPGAFGCYAPPDVLARYGIGPSAGPTQPVTPAILAASEPEAERVGSRSPDAKASAPARRDEFTKRKLDWLAQVQTVSHLAFRTLFVLATKYFSREHFLRTGELLAWPNQELLAKEVGVTSRTIRDVVATTIEAGHLDIAAAHSPGRTKRYRAKFITGTSLHTGSVLPVCHDITPATPEPPRRHTGSTASGQEPFEEPFDKKVIDSLPDEAGRKKAAKMASTSTTNDSGQAPAPLRALPAVDDTRFQIIQIQNLGASRAEAHRLVNRLQAAAPGPKESRRVRAGEAIGKIVNSYHGFSPRHRFERLKTKADRWEQERAGRDAILRTLETGPQSRAHLVAKSRESHNVVEHTIRRMLADKEVIQISFGVYALPQHGAGASYSTTAEAIISTLFAMPDQRGNVAELTAGTGKNRTAVFSMAKELAKPGGPLLQTEFRRGPGLTAEFQLKPATVRAVKDGKPILFGRKSFTLDLPSGTSSAPRADRKKP